MRIGSGPARGDQAREGFRDEHRARIACHLRGDEARVSAQRAELAIGIADGARGMALGERGDERGAQLRRAVEAGQEDDFGRVHSR